MNNTKFIWAGIILAIILSLYGLVGGHQSGLNVGGVTNYDTIAVTGLKVGTTTPTNLSLIQSGICSGVSPSNTIAATSSELWTCSATGVNAGDTIQVTLNEPAAGYTFGSLIAASAIATTSNSFGVRIQNQTGIATSTIASPYHNIFYSVFRSQSTNQGL